MKKTVIILFAALALVALPAVAQEKYSPKPGTFSFGLTFNPMAGGVNYQPGVGDFAKDYITSLGGDAHSMFFLAKEPLASLMLKYRMAPATSLRFNVGFNGSNTHYKEYVDDQVALKANPTGGAKTYDQINLAPHLMGDAARFLLENTSVQVSFHEGEPLFAELPVSVDLTVSQTDPGLQGDRSTGGTKPATLETGAEVQVPLFIETGDVLKIDTRDGSYLSRVNN